MRAAERRRCNHELPLARPCGGAGIEGSGPRATVRRVDTTARLLQGGPETQRDGFAQAHDRVARQLFLWAALHVAPPLRRWLPIEDFVQEVWARAYAGFASFDAARGTFRSWLLGIAYNVLREHLRSLRRRDPRAPDPEAAELRDPATSVVSTTARDERRAVVLAVVDTLGEDERQLVAWRGLEGLAYDEVAQRLGITAAAAESRWRRLLARLHDELPPGLLAD
jgi:RNA polymerase sigma factor (sigma-70 family)